MTPTSLARLHPLSLLALGAALLFAPLAACTTEAPTGGARVAVLGAALDAGDIDRVEVTVTGTGIATPIVVELTGNATSGWSATLTDLPAGLDRTFTGRAYDDTDALIYQGAASPVVIRPGEMSLVTIFMQQVNPPPAFQNTAPRITGLTVSSYSVAAGGTISLSVTAEDPDPDDTLTYAWTSPSGSYTSPSTASTDWTAGGAPGSVVLRIGVSDDTGATATLEIGVTVADDSASAYVSVSINSVPTITSIVPSPTQIDIDDYTYLDLTASDPDGDALAFDWDVTWPCEGYFDDPTLEDPTFTLSAVADEWDDCVLTVDVSDSRGGHNTASISIATGPDVCDGSICGPPVLVSGEPLWLERRHHDGDDVAGGLAYDTANDRIIAVGSHYELDDPEVVIDLFTRTGSFIDSNLPTDTSEVYEEAHAVGVDSAGVAYVGGWSDALISSGVLRQHPSSGLDDGWELSFAGMGIFDVVVDASDRPWFLGVEGDSADKRIRVTRVAAEGPTGLVVDRYAQPGFIYHPGGGLTFDTAGHIVACTSFTNGQAYDAWIGKYAVADHAVVMTTTWGSPSDPSRDELCEDIAVDGLGNIYLVGSVSTIGGTDLWVAKLDASGAFLSEVTWDDGGDETALAVATASNGIIYVGGTGDGGGTQAVLRAFRPTLADLWSVRPALRDVVDVLLDPIDGNVLVTGTGGVDANIYVGSFVR